MQGTTIRGLLNIDTSLILSLEIGQGLSITTTFMPIFIQYNTYMYMRACKYSCDFLIIYVISVGT